ncbi:MAG: toxin complex protein, partial [Pseudomonadota bacterium]
YWQEVSIPKTFELFSDVTICVFKNRYYLFWIELEERRQPTPEGEQKTIWRLHPRYMRCDQNALTGATLTPGLFEHPADMPARISADEDTLRINGAYEWTGARPVLKGTYHPTRAPDGQVYGQLQEISRTTSGNTLLVSFGIDLPSSDGSESPQQTALHIRLSDEWSDAILEWNAALVTIFDDEAPEGFAAVYPRPVDQFRALAEQYNISTTHAQPTDLSGKFTGGGITAYNDYRDGTTTSELVFIPGDKDSASLGSIDIDFDLGQSSYRVNVPSSSYFLSSREIEPTKVRARFHVRLLTSDGQVFKDDTAWQEFPKLVARGSTISADRFRTSFVLPDHWNIDDASRAALSVVAEVERDFGVLEVETVFKPNALHDVDRLEANPDIVSALIPLGEFVLRPPAGKDNTGWAQTGQHGSRTFLHLSDSPNKALEETFVLLSSSSVLSGLAKTMPRPGGCESLFTLKNHNAEPEDFGTFLDGFETTLLKLYRGDDTKLTDDHLPSDLFDFDSAYGAYGWEVFYHIPSAIAAGYASSGQFNLALQWLQKIFDPHATQQWQVMPLIDVQDPMGELAFDTGDVIIDPDRIARDYPFFYQQATIRNYLETLLEAGDAAYEEETQESLQRAKALYVSAKQMFADNLSETLESLTNAPWDNPTLGQASAPNTDPFLPPYNEELASLHATVESRLHNIRHWLSLSGQPLEVALLAPQIDPRQLQRTAKSKLSLGGRSEEETPALPYDFPHVVKTVKGYLNNLKLTSYRLQDASEKEGDSDLEEFRMDAAIRKAERTLNLHDFTIEAAEKEIAIKTANTVKATTALLNHLAKAMERTLSAGGDTVDAAVARFKQGSNTITNVITQVTGSVKSTVPNTFGFSNGGQNLEQSESIKAALKISQFLYAWDAVEKAKAAQTSWSDVVELSLQTAELTTSLVAARLEQEKAEIALDKEEAMRDELTIQWNGAQGLRNKWNDVFGGTTFYKPFREDIEALYAEEWAATQQLCRLLVKVYEEETSLNNGASLLQLGSIGSGPQRFNAPHRLALDIERLETAYLQAMLTRAADTCECAFSLSEVSALGQDHAALEDLARTGETYFELTDEMFDVFYPGQYDRRIQSISISFPGLAEVGLTPNARLTQVSNTRYLTSDRSNARASMIRKDRHGLQSLTLSDCEVDTRSIESPDGLLRRFQNTGVESCWHLVIPSLQEGKRTKACQGGNHRWREAAQGRIAALRENLSDVDFKVRFSGRWTN